jgi:hypothetical protein
MAGRTVRFLIIAVTAGRHGPGGGDDDSGWEGGSMVPTVEEERDNTVSLCGGEGRVNSVVPMHGDGVTSYHQIHVTTC